MMIGFLGMDAGIVASILSIIPRVFAHFSGATRSASAHQPIVLPFRGFGLCRGTLSSQHVEFSSPRHLDWDLESDRVNPGAGPASRSASRVDPSPASCGGGWSADRRDRIAGDVDRGRRRPGAGTHPRSTRSMKVDSPRRSDVSSRWSRRRVRWKPGTGETPSRTVRRRSISMFRRPVHGRQS